MFLRMHIARKDTEDKKAEYVDYELYECLAITYAVLDGHMVIDFVATADQDLNNPESMFPLYQGQLHNPVPERDVEHKDRPKFTQFMCSTGSFELMLHVSQAIACEAIKADIKTTTLMCNKMLIPKYESLGMKTTLAETSGPPVECPDSLPQQVLERLLDGSGLMHKGNVIMQSVNKFPRVLWCIPSVPYNLSTPPTGFEHKESNEVKATNYWLFRKFKNWTDYELCEAWKRMKGHSTYAEWELILCE